MINLQNLGGYFFNIYPEPFVLSAVKLTTAALVIGAATITVLYFVGRQVRRHPPKKRVCMSFFRWGVAVWGATLLLFFFRQQRAYFLAMPAIAVAIYLGLIAWFARIIVSTVKQFPEEARRWREAEERKKYLPALK